MSACLSFTAAATDNMAGLAIAFLFIIGGAVFDFFDGFTARLLGVSSPIGKELDSLADVITFGFAPSAMVFALLTSIVPSNYIPLCFVPLLIAAFSALRLAKFNLDTRQAMGFIGLPTPANALFWGSVVLSVNSHPVFSATHWQMVVPVILVSVLLSCWLLVCEIPMFALKFHDYSWAHNSLRYSFILISAVMLLLGGIMGFAFIIVLYVLLSILQTWHTSCNAKG